MDFEYIGDELELFRHARNWKNYYGRLITPYFGKRILEVGAGIGATTESLCSGSEERWVCLEPDAKMAGVIGRRIADGELPACCEVIVQTVAELPADENFDSVVYIDVLEHIEDDAGEIASAASHLKPGGHLIVLSPAHQFLFTPFDKAIGHYRRYNRKMLSALIPAALEAVRVNYLDSFGAFASVGNRLLLRQSMPTLDQILLWDRRLVPISTIFDPILGYRAGKSILGIWKKTDRA
jgi:SAM-dependent methyltransferase